MSVITYILRAIPAIHEINARRGVFWQRVGKFLLKSIIALSTSKFHIYHFTIWEIQIFINYEYQTCTNVWIFLCLCTKELSYIKWIQKNMGFPCKDCLPTSTTRTCMHQVVSRTLMHDMSINVFRNFMPLVWSQWIWIPCFLSRLHQVFFFLNHIVRPDMETWWGGLGLSTGFYQGWHICLPIYRHFLKYRLSVSVKVAGKT